jgi:hypothetical protein
VTFHWAAEKKRPARAGHDVDLFLDDIDESAHICLLHMVLEGSYCAKYALGSVCQWTA